MNASAEVLEAAAGEAALQPARRGGCARGDRGLQQEEPGQGQGRRGQLVRAVSYICAYDIVHRTAFLTTLLTVGCIALPQKYVFSRTP